MPETTVQTVSETKQITATCGCGKSFATTVKDGKQARMDCRACAFERIAEKRMDKVLNDIRLIGNLASSQYDYSQEHIDMLKTSLAEAIQVYVIDKFNKPVKSTRSGFTFKKEIDPSKLEQINQE